MDIQDVLFHKMFIFNSQSCLYTEPNCKSKNKQEPFCIPRALLAFRKKGILETDVFASKITPIALVPLWRQDIFLVEKTSLWITDKSCIYLSFKQKTTLSTESERLRFAVTRRSTIQWVICFYDIIMKAFIYLVQYGRIEEFKGPLMHCYSDRFVLCMMERLQHLLLLPKLEKSSAAGQLSYLAQKPNLTKNLSTRRIYNS